MIGVQYKASLACEVRANIRFMNTLRYSTFVDIFKGHIKDLNPYKRYLYAFFEECYPSLIKKFMLEQGITREQILKVFNWLPELGEKEFFREAIQNGEF